MFSVRLRTCQRPLGILLRVLGEGVVSSFGSYTLLGDRRPVLFRFSYVMLFVPTSTLGNIWISVVL